MNTIYLPNHKFVGVSRRFIVLICTVAAVFWLSFLFAEEDEGKKQAKPKQKKEELKSRRFFAFDDAPYFTSPDKRIGVKMLIDSAKVGPTLASLQHVTMLPTAHIKSHRHVYVTEIIYVLKGALVLRIDKEVKTMGPNTVAYIPQKTFHEYLNNSGDVVEFLQYFTPSGPEEEYRNWERPDAPKPAKEKVASVPHEIVRRPLPPVPGTPPVRMGDVSEVSQTASGTASEGLSSDGTPNTEQKLELKLKEPKSGIKFGAPTLPAGASSSLDEILR